MRRLVRRLELHRVATEWPIGRQQGAIVYLREQGRITNREYRSLFEVSYDTAYRDLRDLLEKGLVKRQGKGRATYYVLSV